MESTDLKEAKKMTQISTDYGVLCSETTLVAVEKLKEKVEGEAKPVIIPIAVTKDNQQPEYIQPMGHFCSVAAPLTGMILKKQKKNRAPGKVTLGLAKSSSSMKSLPDHLRFSQESETMKQRSDRTQVLTA